MCIFSLDFQPAVGARQFANFWKKISLDSGLGSQKTYKIVALYASNQGKGQIRLHSKEKGLTSILCHAFKHSKNIIFDCVFTELVTVFLQTFTSEYTKKFVKNLLEKAKKQGQGHETCDNRQLKYRNVSVSYFHFNNMRNCSSTGLASRRNWLTTGTVIFRIWVRSYPCAKIIIVLYLFVCLNPY